MSIREKYMTFHKTIRIGRLLEDLDIFAVTLCYKHILNPKQPANISISPYSIVTACVDQINISHTPLRVRNRMAVFHCNQGFDLNNYCPFPLTNVLARHGHPLEGPCYMGRQVLIGSYHGSWSDRRKNEWMEHGYQCKVRNGEPWPDEQGISNR